MQYITLDYKHLLLIIILCMSHYVQHNDLYVLIFIQKLQNSVNIYTSIFRLERFFLYNLPIETAIVHLLQATHDHRKQTKVRLNIVI